MKKWIHFFQTSKLEARKLADMRYKQNSQTANFLLSHIFSVTRSPFTSWIMSWRVKKKALKLVHKIVGNFGNLCIRTVCFRMDYSSLVENYILWLFYYDMELLTLDSKSIKIPVYIKSFYHPSPQIKLKNFSIHLST